MEKTNRDRSLFFLFVALLFLAPFSVRNNYHISDAINYLIHAEKGFNPSRLSDYYYPLYWLILEPLGTWIPPEMGPSYLSIIVSTCLIAASLRLKGADRWVFLFFCILSPAIFNITQVALRNGVALGFILLGLAYGRTWLIAASVLVHPGVLPMAVVLFFLKNTTNTGKTIILATAISLAIFFIMPNIEGLILERGYDQQDSSRLAGLFTYLAFLFLALTYFTSMEGTAYRFFMPTMFAMWIVVGLRYEFGGRLFLQSLPVSLFLLLTHSQKGNYHWIFLIGFLLLSAYGAILWHPLTEYHDGWLGYWSTLFH